MSKNVNDTPSTTPNKKPTKFVNEKKAGYYVNEQEDAYYLSIDDGVYLRSLKDIVKDYRRSVNWMWRFLEHYGIAYQGLDAGKIGFGYSSSDYKRDANKWNIKQKYWDKGYFEEVDYSYQINGMPVNGKKVMWTKEGRKALYRLMFMSGWNTVVEVEGE